MAVRVAGRRVAARRRELNAKLEGIGERLVFDEQSAAALAFPDGHFDVVVSCLTFHEVQDALDKRTPLREAMRVLRTGGHFVFLDLFADRDYYESPGKVRDALVESGAAVQWFKGLDAYMRLPFPLMHGKVLKHAMVVGGTKISSPHDRTRNAD